MTTLYIYMGDPLFGVKTTWRTVSPILFDAAFIIITLAGQFTKKKSNYVSPNNISGECDFPDDSRSLKLPSWCRTFKFRIFLHRNGHFQIYFYL